MTTYALVHGAWGSGWHWGRVPELLRELGHEVVAPDLPCDDPEATFSDYADAVVDALAQAGDDVVVAAFSLGGLTAPLVAARREVREVVYVAAMVPVPGQSLNDRLRGGDRPLQPEYMAGVDGPDDRGLSRWADFGVYRRVGYDDDLDAAVVRERFERTREQSVRPYAEPCPLEALPAVRSRYVMCADDRLMNNVFWRTAVGDRLGADPIVIPGAHSPMASRPEALVKLLTA
jgi:hypothetical protein